MDILTGEHAKTTLAAIQATETHIGEFDRPFVAGYFDNPEGGYIAFDNTTGNCWIEDVDEREKAELWAKGEISTDELHNLQ